MCIMLGELDDRGLIPWDMQMTNTLPDNFLWEKDAEHIIAVAPGLYEVTKLYHVLP